MKDYDISVLYHPDKANVVRGALCRMTMGSLSHVEEPNTDLVKDVHMLARLSFMLEDSLDGGVMVHHNNESSLAVAMKSKQHHDQPLMDLKESMLGKLNEVFYLRGDDVLRYQG